MELFPTRSLTKDEADASAQAQTPIVKRLRHSHHALAKMLAQGARPGEAAIATGYAASRVSILQNDPAFKELVAFYKSQIDSQFLSMQERLNALGLDAVQELQARLDEDSDKFSIRDLMDVVGMARPSGKPGGGTGGDSSTGMTLSIEFVQPVMEGKVIDGQSEPDKSPRVRDVEFTSTPTPKASP